MYPQSMFRAEIWKNIRIFIWKFYFFWVVKFSVYLNRLVFVMWNNWRTNRGTALERLRKKWLNGRVVASICFTRAKHLIDYDAVLNYKHWFSSPRGPQPHQWNIVVEHTHTGTLRRIKIKDSMVIWSHLNTTKPKQGPWRAQLQALIIRG